MELAIAIFIGIWFSLAGMAATAFVYRDFEKNSKKEANVNDK